MQAFAEGYLIPAQLVLAMIGMGATLSVADFVRVLKDGKGVLLGLALQWFMVPALVLVFIEVFDLTQGWAVGLILIAVVPGGAFSNLLTFIAKGNTALSVSVTLVTTVLSVFTVPLLLGVMAASHLPGDFQVPTSRIITEIFFFLVLPLTGGMLLLRVRPQICGSLSAVCVRASVVLLVIIVASSLGTGRIKIPEYGWGPPLMLIAFGTVLSTFTPYICSLLGRFEDDNVALTIEVALRNIALALLLVHFFFPGQPEQGHVLYACLFYAGMSFIIGVPIAVRHRKGHAVARFMKPRLRPDSGATTD